jgi:rhodanese-related sulfurtransferase
MDIRTDHEHVWGWKPEASDAVHLLTGTFRRRAKDGQEPERLSDILMTLTGQNAKTHILVDDHEIDRLNRYLSRALVMFDEDDEKIFIAAGNEPGQYQRLAICVAAEKIDGQDASRLHLDLLRPDLVQDQFLFTSEVSIDNMGFAEIIDLTDDDPYFDDHTESQPFTSSDRTNVSEIEDVTHTIVAYCKVPTERGLTISYIAEADGDKGTSWRARDENYDDVDDIPLLAQRLFAFTLLVLEPEGFRWEYNDGAYNRRSGYDKEPETLDVEIDAATSSATLGLAQKAKAMQQREVKKAQIIAFLTTHGADADLIDAVNGADVALQTEAAA